jgi:MFS family permease
LTTTPAADAAPTQSFPALRHAGYRAFWALSALTMMADNIEHVISYWIIFVKFQSPALGGFAILAHWLPFLFFSVSVGSLADRFDPRRLIQIGMGLFIIASAGWAVLIYTDRLEMWHAAVLLVIHGFAGVFWNPPAQLLIHDIVGPKLLPSAVRLMSTGLMLGRLCGPAIGGVILLALGPSYGLMFNTLIYLPLAIWLCKAPYGSRFREGGPAPVRAVRGFADIWSTIREISGNRLLVSMIGLAGGASLLIGNGYGVQMPGFAHDLGHIDADLSYSMLLAADAAGALAAGFVLERYNLLQPQTRTAFILAMVWCVVMASFAASYTYPLSLSLLFVAGFVELAFQAMAQSLVQLNAPVQIRGRIIGLFHMAFLGLRAFSGITVGLLGSLIGIHWSLALSALALLVLVSLLFAFSERPVTSLNTAD